jgi:prepilin-type N-terminal cleavage/methylation domain-containing protein/prepilin-type processing-associated H-X9-DG protein
MEPLSFTHLSWKKVVPQEVRDNAVKSFRNLRRAFTLVELLVVIGIIGVLVAILLPALSRARDQANTITCAATMRNLGQLIVLYAAESKGSVPFSYYTQVGSSGSPTVGENDGDATDKITYVWWSVLRKYMRKGVQSTYDNSTLLPDGSRTTRFMSAFNCASALEREAGCDYGSNMVIMPSLAWETVQYAGVPSYHQLTRPYSISKLYADNILLWDACELGNVSPPYSRQYYCGFDLDNQTRAPFPTCGNFSNPRTLSKLRFRGLIPAASVTPTIGDEYPIDPGPNIDDGSDGTHGNIRWRHRKGTAANFLFADGSVKTLRITANAGTAQATGEVLRKFFRPRPPNDYK